MLAAEGQRSSSSTSFSRPMINSSTSSSRTIGSSSSTGWSGSGAGEGDHTGMSSSSTKHGSGTSSSGGTTVRSINGGTVRQTGFSTAASLEKNLLAKQQSSTVSPSSTSSFVSSASNSSSSAQGIAKHSPDTDQQNTTSSSTTPSSQPSSPSKLPSNSNGASSTTSTSTVTTHSSPRAPPPAATRSTSTPSLPSPSSQRPALPHLDLANFPPQDLVRLLAALLQQIATANDALRPPDESHPDDQTVSSGFSSSASSKDDGSMVEEHARGRAHDVRSNSNHQRHHSPSSSLMSVSQHHQAPSGPTSALEASTSNQSLKHKSSGRSRSLSSASDPASSMSGVSLSTRGSNPNDLSLLPPSHTSHQQPHSLSQLLTASQVAFQSSSSTLCFHARNIPGISIETYLLRILKYCPTTNEVFLSLLIYFDRMSRMSQMFAGVGRDEGNSGGRSSGAGVGNGSNGAGNKSAFAIDSYNVHRLVVAGVTVASKFFSDVFYTNSRYAKVGGLPQSELNQLELQFILLNDFTLVIPLEEMQRYADQLLLYSAGFVEGGDVENVKGYKEAREEAIRKEKSTKKLEKIWQDAVAVQTQDRIQAQLLQQEQKKLSVSFEKQLVPQRPGVQRSKYADSYQEDEDDENDRDGDSAMEGVDPSPLPGQ